MHGHMNVKLDISVVTALFMLPETVMSSRKEVYLTESLTAVHNLPLWEIWGSEHCWLRYKFLWYDALYIGTSMFSPATQPMTPFAVRGKQ
jgi:hypothetical protein